METVEAYSFLLRNEFGLLFATYIFVLTLAEKYVVLVTKCGFKLFYHAASKWRHFFNCTSKLNIIYT